jgi:dienelactone hydrolase
MRELPSVRASVRGCRFIRPSSSSSRIAASIPTSRTWRAAVCRRGFVALAPDGLVPVGGYPGNDDDGRTLQSVSESSEAAPDMVNSARYLNSHALSTGKLGATGIFLLAGGWLMVNILPDRCFCAADFERAGFAASTVAVPTCALRRRRALDSREDQGAVAVSQPSGRAPTDASSTLGFYSTSYDGRAEGPQRAHFEDTLLRKWSR